MTRILTIGAFASMLLLLSTAAGFAAEMQFNAPATLRAEQSANVLRHAAHAFNEYLSRCALRDQQSAARALTSDAVIEYPLPRSNIYLAVDQSTSPTAAPCAALLGNAAQHASNLWVFPTGDANSVFVQLTSTNAVGSGSEDHFVIIEMRSELITRMRILTATEDQIGAALSGISP